MATGLRIPVGVDRSGGANIETNDSKQKDKLLQLALSERGDQNPFQKIGIDTTIMFALKDADTKAKAIDNIKQILVAFRNDITVIGDIQFVDTEEGAIELIFEYIDRDTEEVRQFSSTVQR